MTAPIRSPQGICAWTWNVREDHVFWSDALYKLFGLDPSKSAPNWENHAKIYTSESFNRLETAVHECLKSGLDYMLDLEAIDLLGRMLYLEAHGAPVRNEKGEIVGLTGFVIDRTAQLSAEEKFHAIADYTVDWESWIGLDGKYLWVNPAVERITGYTPEEILAMPDFISVLIVPEDRAAVYSTLRGALEGIHEGRGENLQIRCLRKDGTTFWLDVSWQQIFDRKGNPLGLRASGRDVTKRVQAEEATRQTARQLKAILESPNGIVFFSLDREYRYTEFSASHWKTIQKIWGVEIEVGMNMLDLISKPEDRKKAKGNFDRALQGEHFVLEEEYGDRNLLRTWYEDHYSPIRDEAGSVCGLTCFVIDITSRRNVEVKARSEQARLLQLINTISDRVYFKDLESRFLMANQIILDETGLKDLSELNGLSDAHFFQSELAAQYREEERLLMESGQPRFDVEEHQVLKDGTSRWMSTSKVPMRDERGEVIGLMGISRDITEQKIKEVDLQKMNMKLKEATFLALSADRAKSEFLGVMSHELRTPLNGILGFADLLLDESQISPDVRDKISVIHSSGHSLLRILEDILEFTRVEGGTLKLQNIPFSLSELAWKCIRIIEPEANVKSLQLSVVLDGNIPPTLLGDPERIQQVLLNLLRNAVKYTDHGSVTLRADFQKSERIGISVEDTGPGIDADHWEKIFLPFTQGDASMGRKFEGIGMGLTISKRLLERMGSDLTLRSELGKGSVFSFELNLPSVSSKQIAEIDGDSNLGKLDKDFAKRFPVRILAVEDNALNMKLLVSLLGNLGYRDVLKATDGGESLDILEKEKVDLIFMDLQMPIVDGLEATRRIRSQEAKTPSATPVRIIALTANASTSVRNECFTAGMNHYISKPFNIRSLAEGIIVRN